MIALRAARGTRMCSKPVVALPVDLEAKTHSRPHVSGVKRL